MGTGKIVICYLEGIQQTLTNYLVFLSSNRLLMMKKKIVEGNFFSSYRVSTSNPTQQSAIQQNTVTLVALASTEKEASDEEISHKEDAREDITNVEVMNDKKKAVRKKRKVDKNEPETPEKQHELTEYELYRLEKIKRNEEELKRLGLYKEPQQGKKIQKRQKKR